MSSDTVQVLEQAAKDLDDKDISRVLLFIKSIRPRKKIPSEVDKIVDSLVGSVPDNGMTAEDYRNERLSRI